MRTLKQDVRELLLQSQALERCLLRVLDEDEDLDAMYLTRLHCFSANSQTPVTNVGDEDDTDIRPSRVMSDDAYARHELGHDEAESMLESHVQVFLLDC